MKKISKETAVRLGLKRYFTGVPCLHGHISERLVNKRGSQCAECNRLSQQRHKARNLNRVRLNNRLAKQKQRARDRQQGREWYAREEAKNQEISHSR